jgi:hypothetical protein
MKLISLEKKSTNLNFSPKKEMREFYLGRSEIFSGKIFPGVCTPPAPSPCLTLDIRLHILNVCRMFAEYSQKYCVKNTKPFDISNNINNIKTKVKIDKALIKLSLRCINLIVLNKTIA